MLFQKIFISDIHLESVDCPKNQLFIKSCEYFAQNTQELYILGDLWCSWIGDDSLNYPQWQTGFGAVAKAITELAQKISVYFMVGNRDFVVGENFINTCNLKLMPDPTVINTLNQNILLTHGDYLCRGDINHLKMAKIIRTPQFINNFLAKPIIDRIKILSQYVRTDNGKYVDIDFNFAEKELTKNECSILIHGHTHNPQIQNINNKFCRYVLHNWDEQPGILAYNGSSLLMFDIFADNNNLLLKPFLPK